MNLDQALIQSCSPQVVVRPDRYNLSTGSSLLNYSISRCFDCGIESGSVVHISGFSGAGRSTFGLTLLAEACINPLFDSYDIYYNDTESQMIDIPGYLSARIAHRIQSTHLRTHESFWNVLSSIKHPFIYFLDSLDGLDTPDGWNLNNKWAKSVFDEIRRRNSILIISTQARSIGRKVISSGGFAIPFYSDYSFALSYKRMHKQFVNGKRRNVGIDINVVVKKSKYKRPNLNRMVLPIFNNTGFDDVESLFMFLKDRGFIFDVMGDYKLPELSMSGDYESFINQMYQNQEAVRDFITDYLDKVC